MPAVKVRTRVQWRNEIGQFSAAVTRGAHRAQEEGSEIGAAIASALATKRTGAMAAGIHSTGHGYETAGLPQDLPQEEGASAHEIGDAGQTLANKEDAFGPVRGPVRHPGNPAVHYMWNSFKLVMGRMMGIVRKNMP